LESLSIVTSGQRALRDGRIVGGGPVVARRQALALAGLGCGVRLIDLAAVPDGPSRKVETWQWGEASGVTVESWELFADAVDAFGEQSVAAAEQVLASYGAGAGPFLVQDALLGSVAAASRRLKLPAIWQPNDYSFVCARSWLLTGSGRRCEVEAGRDVCGGCQLKGRGVFETAVLHAFFLANRCGFASTPIHVGRLVEAAGNRGGNARGFVGSFSHFIAQSQPMHDVLVRYGASPESILRVDYGVDPPRQRADGRLRKRDRITFAYIARPTFEKGLHLVLEAWAKLPPEIVSRARLLVYSPIESASKFQRQRLEAALRQCVNVEVRNESVSTRLDEVYREIDVAVQPSLWIDHNTQTILEALARAVPVIVPRHTSFGYGLVRDGENGLLVDLDDQDSLRSAIARCVCEEALFMKLQSTQPYNFTDSDWARVVLDWLVCLPHCRDRGQ
jgi:glycosyltransferase involved in cell wall biosynthesis